MKCVECNNKAEWLDKYCQECWEGYCSSEWWQKIKQIEKRDRAKENEHQTKG